MLKLEHETSRAELLWRLNGIYDVQKVGLPLVVALMLALTWAAADAEKELPRLPLCLGWGLMPIFALLIRTKMKHHRQRNKELSMYHKLIEMAMWDKFPHTVTAAGQPRQGLSLTLWKDRRGNKEVLTILPEDLGWEHFIRRYRRVLPKLVSELEGIEEEESRRLANNRPMPKPIASMSKIELGYMNIFVACVFIMSLAQIYYIVAGVEIWRIALTYISRFWGAT
jgi:hypothetical protein